MKIQIMAQDVYGNSAQLIVDSSATQWEAFDPVNDAAMFKFFPNKVRELVFFGNDGKICRIMVGKYEDD